MIYNDFDGYAERLQNIPDINRLRQQISAVMDKNVEGRKRLSQAKKAEVIEIIKAFDGFIDWISLSAWILFSGNQASSIEALSKTSLWNRVRSVDYPEATDYLDGLVIERQSFHQLIPRFQGQEKVL